MTSWLKDEHISTKVVGEIGGSLAKIIHVEMSRLGVEAVSDFHDGAPHTHMSGSQQGRPKSYSNSNAPLRRTRSSQYLLPRPSSIMQPPSQAQQALSHARSHEPGTVEFARTQLAMTPTSRRKQGPVLHESNLISTIYYNDVAMWLLGTLQAV